MHLIFKYPKADNLGVAIAQTNSWLTLVANTRSVEMVKEPVVYVKAHKIYVQVIKQETSLNH